MEIFIGELTKGVPYDLNSNYKFIDNIAHGSFGTVIHVIDINTEEDLAIKIINKSGLSQDSIRKMKEEITILKQLHHENIVQFYGYEETNSKLFIMMEYLQYGTLRQWMNKNIGKITEENASIIIHNLLSATDYLHNKQICHRDIKPENIMFSKENDLKSIKLIDFGLSAQNLYNPLIDGYCGTLLYMSPEQIEKKLYSQTVDIWSIGIILYMLLNNNKHPFYVKGEEKKHYCEKIKKGNFSYHNNLSYMAKNLISKLLEPNPSWRYTSDKAIRHPWITRNKSDDIPKTFNEILSCRNSFKNGKYFIIMSIFFNYCKKNNEMFNEKLPLMDEIIHHKPNKKKKIKLYHINNNYVNKCHYFSLMKKEKLHKQKLYSFDIIDNKFEEPRRNSIENTLKRKSSLRKSSGNLLYSNNKSKKQVKIRKVNTEKNPKLLNEINEHTRNSVLNLHNRNYFNNLPKKKNSDYLRTEIDRSLKTRNKYGIREDIKTLSPSNSKFKKLYLSKSPSNKKAIFPNVYSHKRIIEINDEEEINIFPLILPKLPVSNRFVNTLQIGNF